MTLADIADALDEIKTALHEQYPTAPRLGQLDAHIATVAMVAEHIVEEAARAAGEDA